MWNSFRKQSLTWRLYLHGLRCLIWIIFRYHHFKVKAPSGTPFIVRKEAYNEYDPFALACLIPAELELIPEPLRKIPENGHLQQIKAKKLHFGRCARVSDRQNSVFFKQGAILPSGVWQDIADWRVSELSVISFVWIFFCVINWNEAIQFTCTGEQFWNSSAWIF